MLRDRGGSAEIGSKDDGEITDMFEFNGKLLLIKEKSIYELVDADHVDPKRENPDLPTSIQRKILNRGSDSEMVGRTLLTAKSLFKAGHLNKAIDTKKGLQLTLEALQELVAMEDEVLDYMRIEKGVVDEYEQRRNKPVSYAIPSVSDATTRCKTIFQKADHVAQTLIEMVTIFYPDSGMTKQGHFPKFLAFLKGKYGDNDSFVLFVDNCISYLELIRSLRNCLDHRLSEITIKDFEIQVASGDILSPTIELNFRGTKLDRISLNSYLPIAVNNMITVFEELIAHMCNKNANPNRHYEVRVIPETEPKRHPHVKYAFWSPIGHGGFYDQG